MIEMSSAQSSNNIAINNGSNPNTSVKGKQKKKGEKLELDLKFANPTTTPNWATMMDDDADDADIIVTSNYNLPEAPKAISNDIDLSQIPSQPPFKIYLRNLHSSVEREELITHFANFRINNVQMTRDGRDQHSATVEFQTKEDLINACEMNNKSIRGRGYLISLNNDRYGDRGDRRGVGRNNYTRNNTPNDWRSRESGPPRQVFPPPSIDYDQSQYSRGYNRGNIGGSRPRYDRAEDDYPPLRNEYTPRSGYDNRYEDRYNRSQRNDYHHSGNQGQGQGRYGGNWNRNPPSHTDSQEDNWRRAPAQPPQQRDDYESKRGPSSRYEDTRAMMPPRVNQSHRDDSYSSDQYKARNRFDRQNESTYDRRNQYTDKNSDDRQNVNYDYERPGHRNPPLSDYPTRERLASTRSNVSDNQVDDYEKQTSGVTLSDDSQTAPQIAQSDSPAPKERRSLIDPEILKALVQQVSDDKPVPSTLSSYSSIFGQAKPVDTSKKELEIEKKLQDTKIEISNTLSTNNNPTISNLEKQPKDSVPPRHFRRTNGLSGQIGNRQRNDNNRVSALSGDRRGPPRGPRVGQDNGGRVRNDSRIQSGDRDFNDRRRYDNERMGGRRDYNRHEMDSTSRYGHAPPTRSYEDRYYVGSQFAGNNCDDWGKDDKLESKSVNHMIVNKYDRLNEIDPETE
ncbi:hypothetical protein SSS_02023 [Sarcoptes scabiei]|nr:hypothetical protein SSS_02023 [Sarcoptes scabiei]